MGEAPVKKILNLNTVSPTKQIQLTLVEGLKELEVIFFFFFEKFTITCDFMVGLFGRIC